MRRSGVSQTLASGLTLLFAWLLTSPRLCILLRGCSTQPQERTDLAGIAVPQEFLAIKNLLGITSEIRRVYGEGLIFGVDESIEPDEAVFPALDRL